MPSSFYNTTTLNHPFSGSRGKELFEELGKDYIALQFYWDDYGTSNPLHTSTASLYKMTGCYFRILNLPLALQSTYEHIFLAFLAYAKDLDENLQYALSQTVILQLKKLEREGITLLVNEQEHHFPVVLFNVVADNLGLHQVFGYKRYFAGGKVCRMCLIPYDQIKVTTRIPPNMLRTASSYDNILQNGDAETIRIAGLREQSALNKLIFFHVQENPSVDMMHDLPQGHLRHLAALVLNELPNYDRVYQAIRTFPFHGKDAFNIPRPAQREQLKDELKGMTANAMLTFIRFLPLILRNIQIPRVNTSWGLLLKMEEILDILLGYHFTEEILQDLQRKIEEYLRIYIQRRGKEIIFLLQWKNVSKDFKKNDIVVFAQEGREPTFGRIEKQDDDGNYTLSKLRTINFVSNLHCYKVAETGQFVLCRAPAFLIFDGMRLYHGSFIRLPYSLFCESFVL
uniref:Uncharacterized protein n=1 Tax=Panagrolaimus superbus TaxID=310955 RepID=A0A914YI51_9BILA